MDKFENMLTNISYSLNIGKPFEVSRTAFWDFKIIIMIMIIKNNNHHDDHKKKIIIMTFIKIRFWKKVWDIRGGSSVSDCSEQQCSRRCRWARYDHCLVGELNQHGGVGELGPERDKALQRGSDAASRARALRDRLTRRVRMREREREISSKGSWPLALTSEQC